VPDPLGGLHGSVHARLIWPGTVISQPRSATCIRKPTRCDLPLNARTKHGVSIVSTIAPGTNLKPRGTRMRLRALN
jgi:hypothetical protein